MTELSPAATAAAVGTTGIRTPGTTPSKTPRGYTASLAAVNFGVYLALLTPVMVSMAFKIQHISTDAAAATGNLGLVLGVGALFALVANPLAGRLSDRTTSRWGMRRPWILGGAIVGLGAFALIGAATSVWVVLVGWCLAQAAMNAHSSRRPTRRCPTRCRWPVAAPSRGSWASRRPSASSAAAS